MSADNPSKKFFLDVLRLIFGYLIVIGILMYMFRPIPHNWAVRALVGSYAFIGCIIFASFHAVLWPFNTKGK